MSSVILIDSSTGSPVHVLMLSIQAVHGLPRLRAPGIVPCIAASEMTYTVSGGALNSTQTKPCIISFSRQLPCFLMV